MYSRVVLKLIIERILCLDDVDKFFDESRIFLKHYFGMVPKIKINLYARSQNFDLVPDFDSFICVFGEFESLVLFCSQILNNPNIMKIFLWLLISISF